MLVVELLEHVGLELLVLPNRLEDLLALLVRRGLDQIRDLGRVQPYEPAGRHLQARAGHVPDERLDVAPGNKLLVLGVVATVAAREKAPQARTNARVDSGHPPGAVVLVHQVDLAGPDQPGCVHVDQAVVENVAAQQNLAGAPLELGQIQLRGRGLHRMRTQLLDPVDRDEQFAAADARGQADHERQTVAGVKARDDVVDLAEPLVLRVE